MTEKSWKLFAVLAAAGTLLCLIFKWQYAAGFLLGCAVSVLTYKIMERFCDDAISMRNSSGTMAHFLINFAIWAAVLALCAVLPQYLNVLTCAIGLTVIKITIILESVLDRR